MSLVDDLERCFGTKDLYFVFGIDKNASVKDIASAYRKKSLKVHPDRVEESQKNEATKKFQIIGEVYKILSDSEQRQIYDESGRIPSREGADIVDWSQFWASRFGNLEDTIKKFTDEYWESQQEEEDLKESYLKHKGDMGKIIEDIYCRPLDHEPRYRLLIEKWISEKTVPKYQAFIKETKAQRLKRKRKYQREASIASKNARVFEDNVDNSVLSIANLITQRNEDRRRKQDAFLDNLAAKYAAPKKRKKGQTSKK